jgi:group I intron endonuclease
VAVLFTSHLFLSFLLKGFTMSEDEFFGGHSGFGFVNSPEFIYKPKLLISGDFNLFNSGYSGAGVYMISGLFSSSSFQTPFYIGSSKDIGFRLINEHIYDLNNGIHINTPLQNSWNKHGKNNFVYFELEGAATDDQFTREQWYLDTFRPFADEGRGFNIAKDVFKPMLGRKHSEESLKKMSEAQSGENNGRWGAVVSEETKQKISEALKGESHPMWGKKRAPESIKLTVEAKSTFYHFIGPDNQEAKGKNLSEFCRLYNLENSAMTFVRSGKRISHKGWRCAHFKKKDSRPIKFKFISPDGKLHEGENMSVFAKAHNLTPQGLTGLRSGREKSHKGWKLG